MPDRNPTVGFISVESLRWEEDSSTCIVTRTFKNVTKQNLLPLANFFSLKFAEKYRDCAVFCVQL